MPNVTRPPGIPEFLWNSIPQEQWAQWSQGAAAQGLSLDNYVGQNTRHQPFMSDMGMGPTGGMEVLPGLRTNLIKRLAIGGGLASAGAGIAGAGGGAGGAGGGGFVAGGGGGPTLATSSGGGFMSSFGGQSLLNAGLNLAGGYLNSRAQNKANSANIDAMKDRIKLALQQLSPEQITILMRQFLPEVAAVNNPLQQSALQQMNVSAARQGLAGTPYALTSEAGMRGQMANATSTQAFQQAMGLAGQRASAVTGSPFVTQQPNTGFADAFSNTANQIMLARALSQRQPQQAAPYQMPGIPGQGTPQPWERQPFEGTPYQWGFNPGRY